MRRGRLSPDNGNSPHPCSRGCARKRPPASRVRVPPQPRASRPASTVSLSRCEFYLRPRIRIGTSKKPCWPFTGCGSMRSINVRTQALAPPFGRLPMAARSSAMVIGRESTRFTTARAHPAGGTSGRLLETMGFGEQWNGKYG